MSVYLLQNFIAKDLLQRKRLRADVDNIIKCKTVTKFQIENRSSDETNMMDVVIIDQVVNHFADL